MQIRKAIPSDIEELNALTMEMHEFLGRQVGIIFSPKVVSKKFRRRGIGKKLIDILIKKAKKEGINVLTEVLVTNEQGLNFYKKLGFKIVEHKLLLDNQKRIKGI